MLPELSIEGRTLNSVLMHAYHSSQIFGGQAFVINLWTCQIIAHKRANIALGHCICRIAEAAQLAVHSASVCCIGELGGTSNANVVNGSSDACRYPIPDIKLKKCVFRLKSESLYAGQLQVWEMDLNGHYRAKCRLPLDGLLVLPAS